MNEIKTKSRLERILRVYQLDKYIYTKHILIDEQTIPHSHPVLTIHTVDSSEAQLLSTFLHEQMHWFILSKYPESEKTVVDLKQKFPDAKINFPDGSRDEKSTYEHIIVNYYEYQALKQLLGFKKAKGIIEDLKKRLYKWVYATVLTYEKEIKQILKKNNLQL